MLNPKCLPAYMTDLSGRETPVNVIVRIKYVLTCNLIWASLLLSNLKLYRSSYNKGSLRFYSPANDSYVHKTAKL